MNPDFYYVPNPDPDAQVGLLEARAMDTTPTHHNLIYAAAIRRALDFAESDDTQARVMETIYRGTGIPRELVPHVAPTVWADSVGESLMQVLSDRDEAEPDSVPVSTTLLEAILNSPVRYGAIPLTTEGLLGDITSEGAVQPIVEGMGELPCFTEEEAALAAKMSATAYGTAMELAWRDSPLGVPEPIVLSSRQHIALGYFAVDGSFDHMLTVLSYGHPARLASGADTARFNIEWAIAA